MNRRAAGFQWPSLLLLLLCELLELGDGSLELAEGKSHQRTAGGRLPQSAGRDYLGVNGVAANDLDVVRWGKEELADWLVERLRERQELVGIELARSSALVERLLGDRKGRLGPGLAEVVVELLRR